MSYLNMKDVQRTCGYRLNWNRIFVKPLSAALVMGVVTYAVHLILNIIIGGRFVATLVAIFAAVIVYAVGVVKFGVLSREDIQNFPKGNLIHRMCVKLHLYPR